MDDSSEVRGGAIGRPRPYNRCIVGKERKGDTIYSITRSAIGRPRPYNRCVEKNEKGTQSTRYQKYHKTTTLQHARWGKNEKWAEKYRRNKIRTNAYSNAYSTLTLQVRTKAYSLGGIHPFSTTLRSPCSHLRKNKDQHTCSMC